MTQDPIDRSLRNFHSHDQERDKAHIRACLLSCDPASVSDLREKLSATAIDLIHSDISDPIGCSGCILHAHALIVDQAAGGTEMLTTIGRIRMQTPLGIALLTDQKDDAFRRLALSFGVDHVLVKPVDPMELAAVLRNLARLSAGTGPTRRKGEENDTWTLDQVHWHLIAPTGKEIDLTASEFRVLAMLMSRPGIALTREELLPALRSRGNGGHGRSLDTLISKLRSKIELGTGKSFPLRSVRAVGYVFVPPSHSP